MSGVMHNINQPLQVTAAAETAKTPAPQRKETCRVPTAEVQAPGIHESHWSMMLRMWYGSNEYRGSADTMLLITLARVFILWGAIVISLCRLCLVARVGFGSLRSSVSQMQGSKSVSGVLVVSVLLIINIVIAIVVIVIIVISYYCY